ncbi:hypothetical protein IZ6_25600 [Terrihabitans soli]|uniref:Uncharacterized protein n=1 Tax=Terrihabitans soli TaxID=708113 RepID=A0A6S6QW67_9HYPH|nr:hypothetical protein [Terrihabitans soli]BCJ91825.1 hypothetical protein IZ6_25600 [Terrihabitans soli]
MFDVRLSVDNLDVLDHEDAVRAVVDLIRAGTTSLSFVVYGNRDDDDYRHITWPIEEP